MSVIDQIDRAADVAPAGAMARVWRRVRVALRDWRTVRRGYLSFAVVADATAAASFAAAAAHRMELAAVAAVAAGAALVFVGGVAASGGYSPQRVGYGAPEYVAIVRGAAVLFAAALLMSFVGAFQPTVLSVLLTIGGVGMCSVMMRFTARTALGVLRGRGAAMARAVILADSAGVADAAATLADRRQGRKLVGAFVPGAEVGRQVAGVEVLGGTDDVLTAVREGAVDTVVVDAALLAGDEFRKFRWELERSPVDLMVTTDLHDVLPGRIETHVLSGSPMLEVRITQPAWHRALKTVFDRVVALGLLVVAAPVILGSMLVVRATSPGEAIFRQQRIGVGGRPFMILKIRTMSADAEQRKVELENEHGAGPLFKMQADPRITPVGKFLRRFSIDELPQLWNVVRGDMSLVGPRPPLPSEVMVYDSMAVHRLNVRPGLTGMWQVSGRSDLSWEQSVRLDLLYVDNWSLPLDLKILWRTARAVLESRGAY